jgi:hypothetical protein
MFATYIDYQLVVREYRCNDLVRGAYRDLPSDISTHLLVKRSRCLTVYALQ